MEEGLLLAALLLPTQDEVQVSHVACAATYPPGILTPAGDGS